MSNSKSFNFDSWTWDQCEKSYGGQIPHCLTTSVGKINKWKHHFFVGAKNLKQAMGVWMQNIAAWLIQ